jgi:hypothetical protein
MNVGKKGADFEPMKEPLFDHLCMTKDGDKTSGLVFSTKHLL